MAAVSLLSGARPANPRSRPVLDRIALHGMFALFDRTQLETSVDLLLDMLDAEDGDPDIEDDDPAGDPLDLGENCDVDACYLATYGLDQSAGPINERAMWRRHTGLVRAGLSDDAIRAANSGARGFRPGVTA